MLNLSIEPLPTVTANYEHYGLCQPLIVGCEPPGANEDQIRAVNDPLPAITRQEQFGPWTPFIVLLRNNQDAQSVDEPLRTVCTSGAHHALCQPFLIRYNGNDHGRRDGEGRNHSVNDPLSTLDTSNRFGLVQPFIIPVNHGKGDLRSHSVEEPLPTITSVDGWGLAQPFLVKYNGTGGALSIEEPLDTVTAKDRFGLVDFRTAPADQYLVLDIRFRMLQPHELAAATSFPKSYVFFGNREQKVKQIGNAWPIGLAKALCKAILSM